MQGSESEGCEAGPAVEMLPTKQCEISVLDHTSSEGSIAKYLEDIHEGYSRFAPAFQHFGVKSMNTIRFELGHSELAALLRRLRIEPFRATPLELTKLAIALKAERRTYNPQSWAELNDPSPVLTSSSFASVEITATDPTVSRNGAMAVVSLQFSSPFILSNVQQILAGSIEVEIFPPSSDDINYVVCGSTPDGNARGHISLSDSSQDAVAPTCQQDIRSRIRQKAADLQNQQIELKLLCESAIFEAEDLKSLASAGRFIERTSKGGILPEEILHNLRFKFAQRKCELEMCVNDKTKSKLEPTKKLEEVPVVHKLFSLFNSITKYPEPPTDKEEHEINLGAYSKLSTQYPSTVGMFASPFQKDFGPNDLDRCPSPPQTPSRLSPAVLEAFDKENETNENVNEFEAMRRTSPTRFPKKSVAPMVDKPVSWLSSFFARPNPQQTLHWSEQPLEKRKSKVKVQFRPTVDICGLWADNEDAKNGKSDDQDDKLLELGFLFNQSDSGSANSDQDTETEPKFYTQGAPLKEEPGIEEWKRAVWSPKDASEDDNFSDTSNERDSSFVCPNCYSVMVKWDFEAKRAAFCGACELRSSAGKSSLKRNSSPIGAFRSIPLSSPARAPRLIDSSGRKPFEARRSLFDDGDSSPDTHDASTRDLQYEGVHNEITPMHNSIDKKTFASEGVKIPAKLVFD